MQQNEKTTCSTAVDTQWECGRDAGTPQTTQKGQCKRNRLITVSILRSYELLERANRALVAPWRPNGARTATELHFYCIFILLQIFGANFVHVLGNHSTKNKDAVASLRHSRKLYCLFFGVLHYYSTQQDRLGDTASIWLRFKAYIYEKDITLMLSFSGHMNDRDANCFFTHLVFKFKCFI